MIRTAGYTNHWVYTAGAENPTGGFSDTQWDMIVREAKAIIASARIAGITITGPMGTGRPSITSEHISLNGDEAQNLEHETFYLVKTPSEEDRRFHQQFLDTFRKGPTREIARGFCKTNGKPYDAVVASILVVANRVGKGVFKAKSDDGALKRVLASTSKQAEWKTASFDRELIKLMEKARNNTAWAVSELKEAQTRVDSAKKQIKAAADATEIALQAAAASAREADSFDRALFKLMETSRNHSSWAVTEMDQAQFRINATTKQVNDASEASESVLHMVAAFARTATSKQAEWKDWTPDMPVQVVHSGRPPEVFEDLATAQLRYPELNPAKHSSRFTWALRGDVRGRPAIRFEDWAFQRSMYASSNRVAEGLEDACWEGYAAVGMKEKDGKQVPNCVPSKAASNRVVTRHVAAWDNLPEGWTEDSLDSFWESLTGDVKHPVTKCIKRMDGKVSDPGAFCGSLADKADPGWRSRGAADAGGTFRPGDAAVWNGKKVLILDTHGFPAKTVDVRWTESGVSGSRDEVANTKKNVPVSQLTRTASTHVAYNPPFQNAAKADEALGEAYRSLIDLKLGFDSWEEIPNSAHPLYQQIMKAVDTVVTARQSTTQVRAMVARKRY